MTTALADHAYRVVVPCIAPTGRRGSRGVFYQGEFVTPWTTAEADEDFITTDEIQRLLTLGFIEPAG